ncbi:HalOD1 output domain-containing protein [Halobaculum limi]|uniref:HalOD1 output domain-containing protein n=1 Tax=Halobaculum limi TaxID=3031916 RepID=UPI002404DAAA|nr:HalOD1 output domain-containing protein [Halobaculum sp. YSMS11]
MSPTGSNEDPPVSQRVVERVAAAEDVDPVELDARLQDAIDTEALDALIARGSSAPTVKFVFCDYRIVVDGGEPVTVAVDSEE